jgi:hypothetical protein
MYAEWVELDLGNEVICKVFVFCTPDTPMADKQRLARRQALQAVLDLDQREAVRV